MYQPPHFREDHLDVQHAFMRAHPFALLVSHSSAGLMADPAPFLLDADAAPQGMLRAHLARANPQLRALAEAGEALVVFQGADAYVTPSWYATKRETGKVVPTWNYVMVQVQGTVRVVDDRDWMRRFLHDLTSTHEAGRADPWAVSDAPEAFVEAQLKGVVGVELTITQIAGKWKTSQNRPEADRTGVAEGLAAEGAQVMADLVRGAR